MEVLTTKKVIGRHVYGELYGCDSRILADEERLTEIVREAAEVGGFTLLDIKAWKINPGVSVIGIVLESHISIHTWPEYSFATVDVYTCGPRGEPLEAFMHIVRALKAERYTLRVTSRDFEDTNA
ncbi:MAG: adenosylmethionine decarboxylase [Desulfurococcus sp.]|nr:adenosylmethionine decarboxylase [Desulfurococcus sp.]